MKRTASVLLILFFCLSVHASIRPGFSFDSGVVQDLIIKNSSYNVALDARCSLNDNFELRLPVGLVFKTGARMIDVGLDVCYYPFQDYGAFMGLSLIQFGFVSPSTVLSKTSISLNEVILGWTFRFKSGLILEPSVSIRDPSGTFSDEYSSIQGVFGCYKNIRIHLCAGWSFNINKGQ